MILILGHFSFNQPNQDVCHGHFTFCTMLTVATHPRSVPQNFTGSGFRISSMFRIAKNHSYISFSHVLSSTVKQSGPMLLILMCDDVAMNPGPAMLGSLMNPKSHWLIILLHFSQRKS